MLVARRRGLAGEVVDGKAIGRLILISAAVKATRTVCAGVVDVDADTSGEVRRDGRCGACWERAERVGARRSVGLGL